MMDANKARQESLDCRKAGIVQEVEILKGTIERAINNQVKDGKVEATLSHYISYHESSTEVEKFFKQLSYNIEINLISGNITVRW